MRLHTLKMPKAKNAGGRKLVGQRRPWAAKNHSSPEKIVCSLVDQTRRVNQLAQ
jgi:hypothetical protein